MKTKTLKVSAPKQKGFHPTADMIGLKFEKLTEDKQKVEADLGSCKEGARALALGEGTSDGKVSRVQGDKFEITVTDVMSSPVLDEKALFDSLPPAKRALCFTEDKVYRLDEKALIAAVEDGKIASTLVHAATTPPKKKHERIIIQRL